MYTCHEIKFIPKPITYHPTQATESPRPANTGQYQLIAHVIQLN